MPNKTSVLFACLLFSTLAHAEWREAPTMVSALEGAEPGTLVIFDLDNTVMMPPQSLGGEEWYDYFVEKRTHEYQSQNLSADLAKAKAIDQGMKEWIQFHKNASVIPVEADAPQLISALQDKGVYTMALTARSMELGLSTIKQLKSIGIELNRHTVSDKFVIIEGKNSATFYRGALLVGAKNKKGEVLVKFLKQIALHPKKIIFVDNKQHHIEDVEKALAPTHIPYFGRRHGAADQKIASMDKDVVEIQHRYFFGDVLSNEDAKKLLGRK